MKELIKNLSTPEQSGKKIGLFRKYADADKYREKLEVLQQKLNLENTMAKAQLENTKAVTTEATLEAKLQAELKSVEAKMLEIGIIGTQATLEEEGSRLTTTNDMENVANSLAYFKKLLLELENPMRWQQIFILDIAIVQKLMNTKFTIINFLCQQKDCIPTLCICH